MTDDDRFCPICDADVLGNDPHAVNCPATDERDEDCDTAGYCPPEAW